MHTVKYFLCTVMSIVILHCVPLSEEGICNINLFENGKKNDEDAYASYFGEENYSLWYEKFVSVYILISSNTTKTKSRLKTDFF